MISDSPLARFVGNARAVRRMRRFAFSVREGTAYPSVALIGPASTGKTLLARLYAKEIDCPYSEIGSSTARHVTDIYETIESDQGTFVRKDGIDQARPCVVFLDEVHALRSSVVMGLLKAIESSDRTLETEDGYILDTSRISWVCATTDRGDLFDAFDTRFSKILLRPYSREEVARIVGLAFPRFNSDLCAMIAHYSGHVPREAIEFAREVQTEYDMSRGDLAEIIRHVAEDNQIDEHGMTLQRVAILTALGRAPVPAARLASEITVKRKELERFILPPMVARTPDRKVPLVTVSSKGYTITPAGLAELDKRSIKHSGKSAMPPAVRQRWKEV